MLWGAHLAGMRIELVTRHTLTEYFEKNPESTAEGKSFAKILLVEDNVVNQKVAMRMLEKIGCQVESAFNGKEGLEKLLQGNYDLVFIDCQVLHERFEIFFGCIDPRVSSIRSTPDCWS